MYDADPYGTVQGTARAQLNTALVFLMFAHRRGQVAPFLRSVEDLSVDAPAYELDLGYAYHLGAPHRTAAN